MAIEFACPACGATLQVGDDSAGRAIRCGGCMNTLRVPDAARPDPTDPTDPYNPEPPAGAAPVEPRRRRDPDDPFDDRPRRRRGPDDPYDDRPRRRRPPPPPGYGVFFWLVVIGGVMLVGAVACCGGFFLMLPGAKWQKHESKDGGFRVELPGKAQPDAGKAAGVHLEKGTRSEGAVLYRQVKQFFVFYRDVPGTKDRAKKRPPETDEQLIKKELDAVRTATHAQGPAGPGTPVTVGGFDGRELEYFANGGWFTARVVVADTRVYVLLGGGGTAQPGDPDVRKFIDSFEITDPKLAAEGQEREARAKKQADAAKEREERRKTEEAEEQKQREADDLRAAAETVAEVAIAAARRAAPPPRKLPVAPPPRLVEID